MRQRLDAGLLIDHHHQRGKHHLIASRDHAAGQFDDDHTDDQQRRDVRSQADLIQRQEELNRERTRMRQTTTHLQHPMSVDGHQSMPLAPR